MCQASVFDVARLAELHPLASGSIGAFLLVDAPS